MGLCFCSMDSSLHRRSPRPLPFRWCGVEEKPRNSAVAQVDADTIGNQDMSSSSLKNERKAFVSCFEDVAAISGTPSDLNGTLNPSAGIAAKV